MVLTSSPRSRLCIYLDLKTTPGQQHSFSLFFSTMSQELSSSSLIEMSSASSSSAPGSNSSGGTELSVNAKISYAQVVVSFVTAIALLILAGIQLLYRTTGRHRQLLRVQRQTRFDGAYLLGKPENNNQRRIIEEGLKEHRLRITNPPQYDRIIPVVVASSRDSKRDCMEMLNQIRSVLRRYHGNCANLMSMRCCLACVKGVLPEDQSERFVRIYEGVVCGTHRVDGTEKMLSTDDIKFMHAFFYNTILKEIQ